MRLALAIALLVCGACAPTVPVYIQADEPPVLLEAAHNAVDFWNSAVGFHALDLYEVDNRAKDPFGIWIRSVGEVHGPERRRGNTAQLGLAAQVAIERETLAECPDILNWLVAHELGHAIGLGHSDDSENVMFINPERGQEGETLTKRQVRRAKTLLILRLGL